MVPRPPSPDPVFEVGQLLSCRIDTDRLADALNRFYASTVPRPSKSAIVLAAVERFLFERGFLDGENGG
jgi:hypothetical protein